MLFKSVFSGVLLVLSIFVLNVQARRGYGSGEQDWGFIQVRPGAQMFYWLYYTTANVSTNYTERPLAIWLQGGPGDSSTGFGNFFELGPLDVHGIEHNHSWVRSMNVLFIDSPVGSGFSYVESEDLYTTNNTEIAADLVSFMTQFYKQHPAFVRVPLHIFTESYGGKMGAEFALALHQAVQNGQLQSNLKSVMLGSPWISPIDSILSYAPFLLQLSAVDLPGYEELTERADLLAKLVQSARWTEASDMFSNYSDLIINKTYGVYFYDATRTTRIFKTPKTVDYPSPFYTMHPDASNDAMLKKLMLGPVAKALNLPEHVVWDNENQRVGDHLSDDFIKPVVHIVSELLNNTDLEVGVISGQFDLICATSGAVKWIEKLDWHGKSDYVSAVRLPIIADDKLEGYQKSGGKFTMFWVNRAGHSVPADNPAALDYILRVVTQYDQT